MNVQRLKDLEAKYRRNKEGLGFEIDISIDDENPKKYNVKFLNLDRKYNMALKKLVSDMLTLAREYIVEEFKIDYLENDKQLEYLRFEKTLYSEMYALLNNLCNYGIDVFFKNTSFVSIKYKQLYELANVELKNGQLIDRNGNKIA